MSCAPHLATHGNISTSGCRTSSAGETCEMLLFYEGFNSIKSWIQSAQSVIHINPVVKMWPRLHVFTAFRVYKPVNLYLLLRELGVGSGWWLVVQWSSLSGGRHRTVLVTKYMRTRCTDIARFLALNFWSRLSTYRAQKLPMKVRTIRYNK